MLEHRAYPKIPHALPDLVAGHPTWVAMEKIHGAQFVVASDGEAVAFGKRKAWLADDEPFFGWQLLRAELELGVRRAHAELGHDGPIYVYGELFGGHYPGADPASLPGLSAVQTGIWYGPGLHFAAFDLLVVEAGAELPEPEQPEPSFLAHHELEALAASCGLVTAPVLGRGSRAELMRLPVRFASRVPELLGLAPLAQNFAEGLVIKPDRTLVPSQRPVLKRKIAEFDELRFDDSVPFDADQHLSLAELQGLAATMVNPARLASARSKVGEGEEAIAEEALLDVWIDLEAMFARRMASLDVHEEAQLRAGLEQAIAAALVG